VSGRVQVRRDPTDVTIFDSVGFALEDYSSLRYLYRMNRALSQPESIDLIPLPADPKDLFGEFRRARSTNTCLIGAQVARGTRVKA
jgi:ornithine cyclodeaminase